MTRPAPDRPFTTGEVAKLFRVDPKTVARWVGSGRLPAFRTPGGHIRIARKTVLAMLERGQEP